MTNTPHPDMLVLYDNTTEHPEPHEAETFAGLNETMVGISHKTFEDGGKALRSVHAKSHGLLRGELQVWDHLPEGYAQGLFARPGRYPVLMRLSTTPGDIVDDSVSTPRGVAVKVVGVAGDRLPGSENDSVQDFVLVNGPVFNSPNAHKFLGNLKLLAATTDHAEPLKKAASAVLRRVEAISEAFGHKSPTLTSLGGQPETHILGDTFYSQVPIRFGAYYGKVSLAPVSPELTALTDAKLNVNGKPNGLREAVSAFFGEHGGIWEIRIQLCTDRESMPAEDASVLWPEDESPYVSVGRITVAPQDSWSPERVAAIDEGLSFSPWHGLAAHQPLGSIMRARKKAYELSAQFRSERNQRPIRQPRSADDLPA